MSQPSLISRMFRYAPMECIVAVLTAAFAIYGTSAYKQYVHSQATQDAYTPVIFTFGQWPFYLLLLVTIMAAFRAYYKAEFNDSK